MIKYRHFNFIAIVPKLFVYTEVLCLWPFSSYDSPLGKKNVLRDFLQMNSQAE